MIIITLSSGTDYLQHMHEESKFNLIWEKHELTVPLTATECKQKCLSDLLSYKLMGSTVSLFFSVDRTEQEKIASLALSQLSPSEVSHFPRISIK